MFVQVCVHVHTRLFVQHVILCMILYETVAPYSYIRAEKAQGSTEQSVPKVPLEAFTSCTHTYTHMHNQDLPSNHSHVKRQQYTRAAPWTFHSISVFRPSRGISHLG